MKNQLGPARHSIRHYFAVLILLTMTCLLPCSVDPPPGRLTFKTYGPEQGLANPVIWSMAQDERGFVWFGTEDGLFRFDGTRFRGWTLKDGLPATLMEHLCFDDDGVLWVGTYSGLASRKDGKINPYGPDQGIPAVRITGLGLDHKSLLWAATVNGPFRKSEEGGFSAIPGWPGGIPAALAMSPDRPQVWLSYVSPGNYGIRCWENETWRELHLDPEPEEAIEALVIDRSGTLWARSRSLLWAGKAAEDSLKRVFPDLPPVNQKATLYVDPQNRIWIPSSRGISTINNGEMVELTPEEGFSPDVVHALFVDREGSLWLGGNNLRRLLGGGIFRHYTTAHGLSSDVVWTILRDPRGRLLVGTDAGLCLASPEGFSVIPGTEGFQVRSAVIGPDQAVYATGHQALIRWDPESKRALRFGSQSGFQPEGRVFRLRFDREGVLWIATESSGLIKAELNSGNPRFSSEVISGGSTHERFTDIWVDAANRIWAAGSYGLALRENGKWRRFGTGDGLKKDQTAFIRGRSDGTMLLAYFGAPSLTNIDFRNGELQVLRHFDDVFPMDKVVYFFGEDSDRGLWLGTGQGTYLLLNDGRLEHFTRNDGLASENMSNMGFLAEDDGTIWLGTTGGLHRFDANLYRGAGETPATSILEVHFGQSVIPGEALRPVTIPAGSNTVNVSFAAPSSIREGAVQYQARLLGFENEWHFSPNREERYPRLPPGKYVFEARARIGSGEFGPSASWSFEILPDWHQSNWFRIGLILLAAAAITLIVRWRLTALKRRNILLQEMVRERTEELNRANDLLRAQSLTDPLTGLRNRRYLDTCMPEDLAQVHRRHMEIRNGREKRLTLNIDMMFLMIDIDHFKPVNDKYGHQAGDSILLQASEIIRSATRNTDTIVRWGGEEFLVVARNTCRREAAIVAERIRGAMSSKDFELGDGKKIKLTCSVGFAFYPLSIDFSDGLSWEAIINLADKCLYAAKHSGRNTWVGLFFAEQLNPDNLASLLQTEMERFISSGKIKVISSLPSNQEIEWPK